MVAWVLGAKIFCGCFGSGGKKAEQNNLLTVGVYVGVLTVGVYVGGYCTGKFILPFKKINAVVGKQRYKQWYLYCPGAYDTVNSGNCQKRFDASRRVEENYELFS